MEDIMSLELPILYRTKRLIRPLLMLAGLMTRILGAQSVQQLEHFDVASIKLHPLTSARGTYRVASPAIRIAGLRVELQGASLNDLICAAYDLQLYQVSGGPGWAGSDTYDVIAKTQEDVVPTLESARKMLQSLLIDRFHLQVRAEKIEVPVYNLVIAKSGLKLKEATSNEATVDPRAVPFRRVVSQIEREVDRPVVDKTGLAGGYDPVMLNRFMLGIDVARIEGTSISAVIQDEFGLKLEPVKARVDTLIIDHVERPSEN
jgi:uncharacterized protein (TIGR03435 family)